MIMLDYDYAIGRLAEFMAVETKKDSASVAPRLHSLPPPAGQSPQDELAPRGTSPPTPQGEQAPQGISPPVCLDARQLQVQRVIEDANQSEPDNVGEPSSVPDIDPVVMSVLPSNSPPLLDNDTTNQEAGIQSGDQSQPLQSLFLFFFLLD